MKKLKEVLSYHGLLLAINANIPVTNLLTLKVAEGVIVLEAESTYSNQLVLE